MYDFPTVLRLVLAVLAAAARAAGAAMLSPASRDHFPDGQRDAREDLRRDEISPFMLPVADPGEGSSAHLNPDVNPADIHPEDAIDAQAHRKSVWVWNLSKRRMAERRAAMQEDWRPSLTTLDADALLLRDVAIPNGVWTLGEGEHGQLGHSGPVRPHTPHPVTLEREVLRDGVRSVHAGPYCTVVVMATGEAVGFGAGPFRAASDAPTESPPSRLAYEGAPPFRVEPYTAGGGGDADGSLSSDEPSSSLSTGLSLGGGLAFEHSRGGSGTAMVPCGGAGHARVPLSAASAAKRVDGKAPGRDRRTLGGASFEDTEALVHANMRRRAVDLSVPLALNGLMMPVEQIACGEDFCVALMQNGLVFSWGDGEEGKLGLGQPISYDRPTMLDFLLPTAYAEVAKQSENRDALLRAGSKLIRTRGRSFQVTALACGSRHTLALTSTHEIFTWGSGCSGQLGHGGRHDEMLPRPLAVVKAKGRALVIAAGAYHSAAIVSSGRRKPPHLYTWGDGSFGRLGHGDDKARSSPCEVHFHRTAPRKRVDVGMDDRGGGGLFCGFGGGGAPSDWLSAETGHALEWAGIACGSRHCAALTLAGQVYTWGSDDAGQLGHGGTGVMQRLPCLLTTLIRSNPLASGGAGRSRRGGIPIDDVRQLSCGRQFTAALAWSGEVWVWGTLGGRLLRKPAVVESLARGGATVVGLACGLEHVAMVTGTTDHLRARESAAHVDEMHAEAIAHQQQSMAERLAADAQAAADALAQQRAHRAERFAEKRRLKLLNRLAKQRVRQAAGLDKRKEEADRVRAEAKAEKEAAKELAAAAKATKGGKKGGKR